MTSDEERMLRGLLDATIPDCRTVRAFLRDLKTVGIEIAIARFVEFGIVNEEYWDHTLVYLKEIGVCSDTTRTTRQGKSIKP